MKKVVVVGAGIGGLATAALRLPAAGMRSRSLKGSPAAADATTSSETGGSPLTPGPLLC
jgi:thioredoxin reductase